MSNSNKPASNRVSEESDELHRALEQLDDDTKRGHIELQLLQAGKLAAVGELAASVAHELNNPLASISAYAEQLLEAAQSPVLQALPEFRKFPGHLTTIRKNVKRCSEIVRGLVDLARPYEEAARLLDAAKILEDTVALVEHDARQMDISIVRDIAPGLPPVHGKRAELQQVCLNLLTNALDVTPEGGSITVRARQIDGSVLLEIEDQGRGVPPEIAEHIFKPFFTSKPPGKGTGLGLAIGARIAKQMKGKLEFENLTGSGAVFRLTLPAAKTL